MSIVWLAFITGLTTGGISCLAVQGGLLASAISNKGDKGTQGPWGIILFLLAKLVAYTVVGFFLGLLGSTFLFAPRILGWMQIIAGLFMAATALRLIDAHPIFRYAVITPPRWTYKTLKHASGPAILGLFTILMPCGVTQAMMAMAVASGSSWTGAAIMAAFVAGTSPVFFLLGATIVALLSKKVFSYIAAAIVGIFALLSISGGIGLTGSPYTLQNYWRAATNTTSASIENGVQQVTIDVGPHGYTASATTLKKDVPVRLTLRTRGTLGCSRAFTIPEFGISKILPETGDEIIEFTPTKTGTLVYSCSMGMYTGSFEIQ